MNGSPIIVTLVSLGADVKSYEVSSNPKVEFLLEVANKKIKSSETITRSGERINNNTQLKDGDTVIIGENVKGNGNDFQVQLIRLGVPNFDTVNANVGMSIKQIIDLLPEEKKGQYFKADGKDAYEYRKSTGGNPMNSNEIIYPNEGEGMVRLILSQSMKGNRNKK